MSNEKYSEPWCLSHGRTEAILNYGEATAGNPFPRLPVTESNMRPLTYAESKRFLRGVTNANRRWAWTVGALVCLTVYVSAHIAMALAVAIERYGDAVCVAGACCAPLLFVGLILATGMGR